MTMVEDTLPDFKQRCSEIKERIEVLKKENNTLSGKFSVHIYNNDIEKCYQYLGILERNLTSAYEIVEEIMIISTSHVEQLEYNIEQLEGRLDYLERQMNGVRFLATFRDFVSVFFYKLNHHLGKEVWKQAKEGFLFDKIGLELTEQQNESIEELKILLEGIGMSLNDVELLRKVKDQSNVTFHSNNLSLEEVELLLYDNIPDEMNQYKPSLQKALNAIGKWKKSSKSSKY